MIMAMAIPTAQAAFNVYDVEILTPGVNIVDNVMYFKSNVANCAYSGRFSLPMNYAGSEAFKIVKELHEDGITAARVTYQVVGEAQGSDLCQVDNIRKP